MALYCDPASVWWTTPATRSPGRPGVRAQPLNLGVDAAGERADLAPGQAFDRLAELPHAGVLEEHPDVAQPLVLVQLHQVALRRRQRLLQHRDHDVRAGPVRAYPRRPPAELLLVQPHHLPGDQRQRAQVLRLLAVDLGIAAWIYFHRSPFHADASDRALRTGATPRDAEERSCPSRPATAKTGCVRLPRFGASVEKKKEAAVE